MKKILNELFYVPKYGKVKESVFLARMGISITGILLCLVAMSFAGYAYFSSSVTSGINVIQAASFTLDVNGAPVADSYRLTSDENVIVLTWSERTTASVGYGKILVYDSEGREISTHYTQTFTKASEDCTIIFTIPDGACFTVKIIPEWGTCAMPADALDGTTIDLTPFAPPVEENRESPEEDT